MQERDILARIWIVAVLLTLAIIGLGVRLGYLHLANYSKLDPVYSKKLLGLRGRIFDCNGDQVPMAASLPARRYFLDPRSINPKHDLKVIAKTLSETLGLDEADVLQKCAQTNTQYIRLGISLDDQVHALLTDKKRISGVGFEDYIVRSYAHGHRMSHVVGFVNKVGEGGAGIEQQYDEYLRASAGLIRGKKDGVRIEIPGTRDVNVPAIPGNDVHLTLDHNIQYETEVALKEVVEKFQASSGWAIVQRIKTGEILAMASTPDFDPACYYEESVDVWRNNALAIIYEPGSIMKAVTVAAALNERLVTPDTVIDTGDGAWSYAGKVLHDHVTGRITVSTALKKSSNIACAKIALMLGNVRLEQYMRGFNFGARLGIDLPGEEEGILGRAKAWGKLKPTRIAIGQGVAVTGLQMINAYSTLANDGVMMKPYVVDKVVSADGKIVLDNKPTVLGRPVRPEVARTVREMLMGVTEDGGTGTRATVPGYSVGGKTGTAQKAIPGGYSHTDYYASFVGFVPARNPVFSVLVSVERPRPQHTGGFVAAPAFARIAAATARYLEVPPDEPAEGTFSDLGHP